ncbi:MAG TPA: L,D-transpeptidase family protein [Allosphingosinicella sp.]
MHKPLLLALAALLAGAGCTKAPEPAPILAVAAIPASQDAEVAAFYVQRGGRPLWINRGGERRVLDILAASWSDGFDPARYRVAEIAAALRAGDPQALARADLLLSEAWVRYRRDLAAPAAAARPIYAEEGLAPAPQAAKSILEAAAAARDVAAHADEGRRLNSVYDGLRDGFADYRRRWSSLPQVQLGAAPPEDLLRRRLGLPGGAPVDAALRRFQRVHALPPTGQADAATVAALNLGSGHYERIVRANLERARAIPPQGGRFVLVDTAAARVWMFEGARAAGTMRAIVGKRGMETPALAGRLRYAVLNPYWNVPVDLARQRAQRVLREGTSVLARERLQILSQFHTDDRVLSPASVNWGRVAAGREPLRLRQLPGGANVMGAVKFMMPNGLDIYLHDFPDKALFAGADRRISSGCVRLEDAQAFARWLFGGTAPQPSGPAPEQRVDLPAPVPVYISYFTAVPDNGAVAFQADPEGRDAALIAALAGAGRRG